MNKKEHKHETHHETHHVAKKTAKKWLSLLAKITIWVAWAVVILLVWLRLATPNVTGAAENFFTSIQKWDIESAYEMTIPEFQKATRFEDFKMYLENNYLKEYQSSIWSQKEVENNSWYVKWVLKTTNGIDIWVEMMFVKINWTRKIYWVSITPMWVDVQTATMPTQEVVVGLIHDTFGLFADAIKKGDFTEFYNAWDQERRQSTSIEKLNAGYKEPIEKKIDFSFTTEMIPTVARAPQLQGNLMYIEWFYNLWEKKLQFAVTYLFTNSVWKMHWINIAVK